ncbi:hypothetical protein GQ53DRAFT_842086 [Thozetella sp. PMI_491]|nr:hypothetical protein GQ53DRAFT_842086 [Thozetella sp. PMI_491]
MWCTYTSDKLAFCNGSSLCSPESLKIQLPCNERNFELEISCHTSSLDDISNPIISHDDSTLGIGAYLIRIIDLRDQIQEWLCSLSSRPHSPKEVDMAFGQFHRSLANFGAMIPPDLRNTDRAIFTRVNTPEATGFVMIQSWWHTTYCQLFGHFAFKNPHNGSQKPPSVGIPQYGSPEFFNSCTVEAVRYAASLTTFWRKVQKISKSFLVTDWQIASCLLENVRINVKAWETAPDLLGSQTEVEQALQLDLDIFDGLSEISSYLESMRAQAIKQIEISSLCATVTSQRPLQE